MGTRHKLLIADSHADCRETLGMALEYSGWKVGAAASCQDALAWLRDATPVAVLLDMDLRGGSGLDVARVMRSNPRFDGTRIVLTGTWFTPEQRAGAAAVPVDEVCVKPIDFGALTRRLERALALAPGAA